MVWRSTDVMSERIKFVVRACSGEEKLSALCDEFGIHRSTGYRWRERYLKVGDINDLKEYSRAPRSRPNKTSRKIEEKVIALRGKYGWGARKLQVLLEEQGLIVPEITINRILKREGLTARPEFKQATQRFEREFPNELWQMDFKGPISTGVRDYHPLSILDDHSRYAVGLHTLKNQKTKGVLNSLLRTFEEYGLPEAILSDRGTPWWNEQNRYGLTRLGVWLIKQDIKLLHGRVRHPQTQGKVERFHRTMKDAVQHKKGAKSYKGLCQLLVDFRKEYNEVRPHEALAMARPVQKYFKSSREYVHRPHPWEYSSSSIVLKVDQLAMVSYRSNRFYISEALKGEEVALEKLKDSFLVRFRNMYIRKISPSTGKNTAVFFPVEGHP